LLILKKYKKKIRKIKIYQKEKDEGPIWRTNQHFTYKYKPKKNYQGRGNFELLGEEKFTKGRGQFRRVKKEKKETLNLSLLQAAARPPSLNPLVSSPSPIC
jgi:hypothetical protein